MVSLTAISFVRETMSYIDNNLLAGEQVVYRARLHWILYLPAILLFVVAILVLVLMASQPPENRGVLLGLAGLLIVVGLISGFLRWIDKVTSEFGVTNHRVIIKVGLIRRRSIELLLRQVEGIGVDQGILGRILGYGQITVAGTGGTKEPFKKIANPLEFRRQVQSQSLNNP
jgi:uncharacterized membrane protein YdbT with pleckstrin-like domain